MNIETVYYATLILLIAASIPAAWWLKREADKAWRTHQRRESMRRVTAQIAAMTDAFTVAGIAAQDAAAKMSAAFKVMTPKDTP